MFRYIIIHFLKVGVKRKKL